MVNNMFVLFHGYLVHKTQGNTVLIQYVNECAKQLLKQISRNHDNVPESWSYDCFLNSCDHNSISNLCKLCALINKQKPRGTDHFSLQIIRRSLKHFYVASLHDKAILIWIYTPRFKHRTYSVKKKSQFPLHMWVGSKTLDLPLDHFFTSFDWRGLFSALPPFDHFWKKIQY